MGLVALRELEDGLLFLGDLRDEAGVRGERALAMICPTVNCPTDLVTHVESTTMVTPIPWTVGSWVPDVDG
jgi:hypothetical protein